LERRRSPLASSCRRRRKKPDLRHLPLNGVTKERVEAFLQACAGKRRRRSVGALGGNGLLHDSQIERKEKETQSTASYNSKQSRKGRGVGGMKGKGHPILRRRRTKHRLHLPPFVGGGGEKVPPAYRAVF